MSDLLANLSFNKGSTVRPGEDVAQERERERKMERQRRMTRTEREAKERKWQANNKGITGET